MGGVCVCACVFMLLMVAVARRSVLCCILGNKFINFVIVLQYQWHLTSVRQATTVTLWKFVEIP